MSLKCPCVRLNGFFCWYAVAMAKTMVDILNEPDFGNLRWEAYNGLPGVGDLYFTGHGCPVQRQPWTALLH